MLQAAPIATDNDIRSRGFSDRSSYQFRAITIVVAIRPVQRANDAVYDGLGRYAETASNGLPRISQRGGRHRVWSPTGDRNSFCGAESQRSAHKIGCPSYETTAIEIEHPLIELENRCTKSMPSREKWSNRIATADNIS